MAMQDLDALPRAAVARGDVAGIAASAGNAAGTPSEGPAGSRGGGAAMAPEGGARGGFERAAYAG
jgi:hypothetical protein